MTRADPGGFESPEAAALAGWAATPAASAKVISVTVRGDRAEVVIDTDPSHPDYVYCLRRSDRWFEQLSGNGPSAGWDDPGHLAWE